MRSSRLALIASAAVLAAGAILVRGLTGQRGGEARAPERREGEESAAAPGSAALAAASEARRERAEGAGAAREAPQESALATTAELAVPEEVEADIRRNPPREALGSLRILVVGPEGAPVTGAGVSLHRADFCGQEVPYDLRSRASAEGSTDGDGVALVHDLAGGAWHVVVTSRGGISWRGRQPSGQAHAAAEVQAKGLSSVTVALDVGLVIAGRVVVPGDEGFRDVSVVVRSEIGCGVEKHPVQEDGTFRIDGLCRGPWRCHATSSRALFWEAEWPHPHEVRPFANSAALLVTESREDVELVLAAPSLISGRLLGGDVDHCQGAAINLGTQHRYGLSFQEERFTVSGVDPGTYLLIVQDGSSRWGVVGGVEVEEGSTVAGIQIPLEPCARLSLPAAAEDGCVSVFLDGVLLPPAERMLAPDAALFAVPPRRLDVELRLDGQRRSWTLDAFPGQTHALSF